MCCPFPLCFPLAGWNLLRLHPKKAPGRIGLREGKLPERTIADEIRQVNPGSKCEIGPRLYGVRPPRQRDKGELEVASQLLWKRNQMDRRWPGRSHNKS